MDNKMIERCAWAIVQSLHWNIEGDKPLAWADLDPSQEKLIKNSAIACIKAMREPTEKMIETEIKHSPDPYASWTNMIDSITND